MLGFLGSLLLWQAPARSASLTWNAPDSCPELAEVKSQLELARGGPLADAGSIAFAAQVTEGSDGRFTLTLRTVDEKESTVQTRTLTAEHCEELVIATGQMVSLALGPRRSQTDAKPAEASGQPKALESQTEGPSSKHERSVSAERSKDDGTSAGRPEAHSTAHAGAPDLANDPGVTAPPGAGPQKTAVAALSVLDAASLGAPWLGIHLEGAWLPASAFELRATLGYHPHHNLEFQGQPPGVGGRFELALAGLSGCTLLGPSAWSVLICAGMEGGHFKASGVGVSKPASEAVPWLAGRTDARVKLQLTRRFKTTALAGLVFPLARHDFSVAGVPLHRIPAISVRAALGAEYDL